MPTAPSVCVFTTVCVHYCVCALGWVKYREHNSLLVILCIIVTKKIKKFKFFMVKCLNIGQNIAKPIYRSISSKWYCYSAQFSSVLFQYHSITVNAANYETS